VPVSKKRKTKQKSGSYPQKKSVAPPKKITKQKILIYVISILMIASLMAGYLFSGASSTPAPTAVPQSDNILQEAPAPDTQTGDTDSTEN
jgi:hypothetical protein